MLFEPLLARVDLSHALDHHLRRQLLEHHAAHAEAERFDDFFFLQYGREQHHPRRRLLPVQLSKDGEPFVAGHVDVEDQHVRAMGAHGGQALRASHTACHHLKVRLEAKQILQPVEDDRVIVGQYNADRHATRPSDRLAAWPRAGRRQALNGSPACRRLIPRVA